MPDADAQKSQEGKQREIRKDRSHMHAANLVNLCGSEALAGLFAQPCRVRADEFCDARRVFKGKIYPAVTLLGLGLPVVGPRMFTAELLSDRGPDATLVGPHCVVVVAAKLLGGKLPVRLERPLVRAGQRYHPALGAVELQIQV